MKVHVTASLITQMITQYGPFRALATPGFMVLDQTQTLLLQFTSASYPGVLFVVDGGGAPIGAIGALFGGPSGPIGWQAAVVSSIEV